MKLPFKEQNIIFKQYYLLDIYIFKVMILNKLLLFREYSGDIVDVFVFSFYLYRKMVLKDI